MGDCPTCRTPVRDDRPDRYCAACGWRADRPAPVLVSRRTLSTPWGLRRRRRSVAREVRSVAIVDPPGVVSDLGLVALDDGESRHDCTACRDAASIFGSFSG